MLDTHILNLSMIMFKNVFMSDLQPLIEIFKLLPEDISRRAILNSIRAGTTHKYVYTDHTSPHYIADALQVAFQWVLSPEGHHYWQTIRKELSAAESLSDVKYPSTQSVNNHI